MRYIFFAGLAVIAAVTIFVGGVITIAPYNAEAAYLLDTLIFVTTVASYVCIASPFVGLLVFLMIWSARQRRRERQMIDGAFPLRTRRVHHWDSKLHPVIAFFVWLWGEELTIDPNRQVTAAWSIRNGRLVEHVPAAGFALQHQYNALVEWTNQFRAMFHGDDAVSSEWGSQATPPKIPAAKQPKALAADQLLLQDPDIVDGDFTPVDVTFDEALRQSTPTALPLGKTEDGEVFYLDVLEDAHARFHGATQKSGKTNLILQLVLAALRHKWHVIVIDRRQFKDWSGFEDFVELINGHDDGAFLSTVQQLVDVYKQRDLVLKQNKVRNLASKPSLFPRVAVVISEFGSACREVKDRSVDEYKKISLSLGLLAAEAAATGIHLFFEDQAKNRNWPPEMRGNILPVSGYLPADAAKLSGYPAASSLQKFHFLCTQGEFSTWNMNVEAQNVLSTLQPMTAMLIDQSAFAAQPEELDEPFVDSFVTNVRAQEDNSAQKRPEYTSNVTNEVTNANANAQKWLDFVRAWRRDNPPPGGQSSLARQMAAAEGNIKPFEKYKGVAHDMLKIVDAEAAPAAEQQEEEQPPPTKAVRFEDLSIVERLRLAGIDASEIKLEEDGPPLPLDKTNRKSFDDIVTNGRTNGTNGHTNGRH